MQIETSKSLFRLVLLAFFTVALMSIVPVVVKRISANPATIGTVRLAIAFVGSIALLRFSQTSISFKRSHLKYYALLGFLFGGHWYSYFLSIKEATPVLAAIGVSTFGVFLLFLNRLAFGEKIKGIDFAAVLLALAGVIIASPQIDLNAQNFRGFLIGIFSGLTYAIIAVVNRKGGNLGTNQKAVGQFGFALLGFCLLFGKTDWNLSGNDWLGLIVLGVVSTLAAHTLWIKVTAELPGNIVAVIYYFYVPLTMLWSFLFISEVVGMKKLAGAAMIICANIIIAWTHQRSAQQPSDHVGESVGPTE